MSRYIIELDYDLQRVVGVGVKQGTVWVKDYDVDDLEELCADYINEHFGELQQDAYDRGYKDGRNVTETQAHDDAYQRGLEDGKQVAVGAAELREKLEYQKGLKDAWEAARRISVIELNGGLNGREMMKIYGTMDVHKIYDDNTASEAIAKLKAYEEKQSDKIKVKDEVIWTHDENIVMVVTSIYTVDGMEWCDGICRDGKAYSILTENARKTGRHFDIEKLLEAMKA